jgi:hypothetical protein
MVKWGGEKPTVCGACEGNFDRSTSFVDGAIPTSTGPMWGLYHVTCFKSYGGKLGTGRGQKFDMKTLEKING